VAVCHAFGSNAKEALAKHPFPSPPYTPRSFWEVSARGSTRPFTLADSRSVGGGLPAAVLAP
jgi:hypothetical protein